MFSRIKTRSILNERRLANFANVSQYSVSHRWQIKENIRMAKVPNLNKSWCKNSLQDIRFYVFGIAAMIMFYLPIFFVPPLVFSIRSLFTYLNRDSTCQVMISIGADFLNYPRRRSSWSALSENSNLHLSKWKYCNSTADSSLLMFSALSRLVVMWTIYGCVSD